MLKNRKIIAISIGVLIVLLIVSFLVCKKMSKDKTGTGEDNVLKNSIEMILDEEKLSRENGKDSGDNKAENGDNSKSREKNIDAQEQERTAVFGTTDDKNTRIDNKNGQHNLVGAQTDGVGGNESSSTTGATDTPESGGKPQIPGDETTVETDDPEQGEIILSDNPYELPLIPIS